MSAGPWLTRAAAAVGVVAAATGLYIGVALVVFPYMTVSQERRTFKNKRLPMARMCYLSWWWLLGCLGISVRHFPRMLRAGFLGKGAKAEVVPEELEDARHDIHWDMGSLARTLGRNMGAKIIVTGEQHLPKDRACVLVANHTSMMDVVIAYFLGEAWRMRFVFVSKSSLFFVPGIGWSMHMCDHVPLTRGSKTSVQDMFDNCRRKLEQGWSILMFPQGTRDRTKVLPFKKGAFALAVDSGAPVVPVTVHIPLDCWFAPSWEGRFIVHEPIIPPDCSTMSEEDRLAAITDMQQRAYDAIVPPLYDDDGNLKQ